MAFPFIDEDTKVPDGYCFRFLWKKSAMEL